MELIYCAGKSTRYAQIAIEHGFTYGAQLPNNPYHPVEFSDLDPNNLPDRQEYMDALKFHRPRLASVMDCESEDDLPMVLDWANEAVQYIREAIIIIPKTAGIIRQLPRTINGVTVRLGYSVPTPHGGTKAMMWEYINWPIHLLGGSPPRQHHIASHYPLDVRSADGNGINRHSQNGRFFAAQRIRRGKNSHFPMLSEVGMGHLTDAPYHCMRLSFINIRALWMGCGAAIRYATEDDLPQIKYIANQYKNELGYVMWPALREAIEKCELYVAESNGQVVGFCNWHKRRDGWRTIYEIAVDKQRIGENIGRALLDAVPNPRRLKCTTDNPANGFYEHVGMTLAGVVTGRKRPLNLWAT